MKNMPKEVKKLSEKSSIGRLKNKDKKFKSSHIQKRRSKRILARNFLNSFLADHNYNLTVKNSKLHADESPPPNQCSDENFNLRSINSKLSDNQDEYPSTTILHLPNEMLCQIFSNLSFMDLQYNVGNVCQHWKAITKNYLLCRNIQVDGRMKTNELLTLLSQATLLRRLEITSRCDANAILRKVITCCPKLKYISLSNCHGSKTGNRISFGGLIKAVTTNTNLTIILKGGTGLSPPPPSNSKIMKQYVFNYYLGEGNVITIIPVSRS